MDKRTDALRETFRALDLQEAGSPAESIGRAETAAFSSTPAFSAPSLVPPAPRGMDGEPDLRVKEELGRGGMATVYLAEQRSLRREVALKRLHGDDPQGLALLLHEATITGQLEHPNIVPVHAIVEGAEGATVVMKRVAGTSWAELVEWEETPLERHLEIFVQVCNAVAFAHSRAIVHLDIKPDNVMIGDFGEVYLMDWGLARSVGDAPPGPLFGTPCYMAPEMTQGQFSAATDIYLLGATLHEVLTGSPPHLADDLFETLVIAAAAATPLYPPTVPEELAALCRAAMAPEPADRPGDAADLRRMVEAHREHRAATLLIDSGDEAAARLASLIDDSARAKESYPAIQSAFSEARIAYEQALRIWPESVGAKEGLRGALCVMIEHELGIGHADTASSLLASVDEPPPELVARVEEALAALEDTEEKLARLEREGDASYGADQRSRALALLAMAVLVMTSVLTVSRQARPDYTPTPERLAMIGGGVLAIMLIVLAVWRRSGWNQANRRIAGIAAATIAVSFFHRLAAAVTDAASENILIADGFILGLGGLGIAVFHPAGRWLAAIAFTVSGLGVLWPDWVDDLFVAASMGIPLLAFASAAWRGRAGSGDGGGG